MFYCFEFERNAHLDEHGNRKGMYYRFRTKEAAIDWVRRGKRRIYVPSSDKELKMLKHRRIIDAFTLDGDK